MKLKLFPEGDNLINYIIVHGKKFFLRCRFLRCRSRFFPRFIFTQKHKRLAIVQATNFFSSSQVLEWKGGEDY